MKPIKFDLIVDRVRCHDIKTLQENFNILDVMEYFESGKLEKWLNVRNISEFEAIQAIDKQQDKVTIAKLLCNIFHVEVSEYDLIDNMMALDCYQQKKTDLKTIETLFKQYAVDEKMRLAQFIIHDDGTAFDTRTHLTWCRYLIGQRWENGEVVGDAKEMTWSEGYWDAVKLFNESNRCDSFIDWRMPKIEELSGIVENYKKYSDLDYDIRVNIPPPINQSVFPKMPKQLSVWSHSTIVTKKGIFSDEREFAYFDFCYNWESAAGSSAYVLLVRDEN
ncbi:MAG: DUF1566 domain-containing protein [Methylococcales bacterium]|nr:DUF1566 domain-containing protein [Methylococcales bacterium]